MPVFHISASQRVDYDVIIKAPTINKALGILDEHDEGSFILISERDNSAFKPTSYSIDSDPQSFSLEADSTATNLEIFLAILISMQKKLKTNTQWHCHWLIFTNWLAHYSLTTSIKSCLAVIR